MTKQKLVNQVAEQAGIKKVAAAAQIDMVLGALVEQLKETGKVSIPGIGRLTRVVTPARTGVSFGKEWAKAEGTRVKFRATKGL